MDALQLLIPKESYRRKTIYVPYLGDFSYVIVAGLRACRMDAVVLPPPDEESMDVGLHHCRGGECAPCFATIGDCLRLLERPGFNPDRAILFFPTISGPCRFGQYVVLLRDILNQKGLHTLEIASPSPKDPFQGFGNEPIKAFHLIWQGIIVVDLLQKLRFEYRPYELNPGQTDELYELCLGYAVTAIEDSSEALLERTIRFAARQFSHLPVDMSTPRPRIGIVGELLVRVNPCINLDIIRRLEAEGGMVMMSSMTEWIYHALWVYMNHLWETDQYVEWAALSVVQRYQHFYEHKYTRPVEHLLTQPYDTPITTIMHHTEMIYDSALAYESTLNIGKAIDFARRGASGLINVMPFSCMPGIITSGVAPHLRKMLGNIPWLDVTFDAQAETNITTRIEAFMHQASTFHRYQRRNGRR